MIGLRRSLWAFWAALLAVLLPLALGPAMAAPRAATHICGQADHVPAQHQDCLHCPLCAGVAAQAVLPVPAGTVARGLLVRPAYLAWVPRGAGARAPPVCDNSPRGPPVLF